VTPRVHSIDRAVGGLTAEWAKKTGLTAGIPVAVGAFDAHLGAVGAGVKPGTLVKIIGTSTCDISVRRTPPKSWRTCPASAASWTAACCPVISASKPASRRWATFSTGG
jgi:ribulose kinase